MGWGNFLPVVGDIIGGVIDQKEGNKYRNQQDQTNQFNYDMQKEFAQNSLRWKVADAQAAGLHPLAALGASGYSASPSHITAGPDESMGNMARSLGQNLSRAAQATMTAPEREMNRLNLEKASLENELLRTQINNLKKPPNPPMPAYSPDFGFGGLQTGDIPSGYNSSSRGGSVHPEKRSQTYGYYPDISFAHTPRGLAPYIPTNLSESYESDPVGAAMWRWRNSILPNFGDTDTKPPLSDLPKGFSDWKYNRYRQQWVPSGYKVDLREGYDYRRYK